VSIVTLFILLPKTFPGQHQQVHKKGSFPSMQRVDFLGAMFLLGACVLIVTAMQQAAEGYSFSSPVVLPLLVFSGILWIGTILWQWFINDRELPEPVFPWRFVTNRVYMGMILYRHESQYEVESRADFKQHHISFRDPTNCYNHSNSTTVSNGKRRLCFHSWR
jgi:hypothetical protein